MSAPLVVNTVDGTCWTRREATRGGEALYALAGCERCPELVMATYAELAEHGIAGVADVLPVPVGAESQGDPVAIGRSLDLLALMDDRAASKVSPVLAAVLDEAERLRARIAELEAGLPVMQEALFKALDRVTELEAERHTTNEALDDAVQALRARGADESADVEPIRLCWGLNDVEWCDDDNTIVLLSGPEGEPYTLELEPSRAAVLRDLLAGPDGPAAFRAAWDTEQVGPLYGSEDVARAHCERDARADYPDGTVLVWRAFRDDDAQLFTVEAGEERPTGYTVTRLPLASEFVEEGGE